jgi:putative Holliday junction resolvase
MKYLALDLGEQNIGLAMSDKRGIIAEPHSIIRKKADPVIVNRIKKICVENNIEKIVVGIPLTAEENRQQKYRKFGKKLRENLTIPVDFWDETFSTKRAQNVVAFLDDAKKRKKTQTHRDDVAAAFILQEYLDHEKDS